MNLSIYGANVYIMSVCSWVVRFKAVYPGLDSWATVLPQEQDRSYFIFITKYASYSKTIFPYLWYPKTDLKQGSLSSCLYCFNAYV